MANKQRHMRAVSSRHNFPGMATVMRTEIPFFPGGRIIKVYTGAFIQPVPLPSKSFIPSIRVSQIELNRSKAFRFLAYRLITEFTGSEEIVGGHLLQPTNFQ